MTPPQASAASTIRPAAKTSDDALEHHHRHGDGVARKLKRRVERTRAERRRVDALREGRVRKAAADGTVARVPFRIADTGELAGLVSRSQKHLPTRL